MRIFFSAGEASGDAYAAALASAVKARIRDVTLEGIGGPKLRDEGAALYADTSKWGAISIVESFKVAPRILGNFLMVRDVLRITAPALFVPIDFGFVNIKLAKAAKAGGAKVLYFIPPGSWRKDRQGADLPKLTDAIVTPFSWSAEILNKMGANAYWYGHPMKQMMSCRLVATPDRVAILPGSRRHEIEHNLPVIARACEGLGPLVFGVAANLPVGYVEGIWRQLAPGRADEFVVGDVSAVLSRARAAIVCSGTATLQAAICGVPMVVIYRLSKTMELEAKIVRPKFDFISLPNIFLGRRAVPELIQNDATPENIRRHLDSLLADSPERERQLADFEELDDILGPSDAIDRTADLIAEMLWNRRPGSS